MSTILIVGPSGSGKSRAIKTLPPEETLVISVSKGKLKDLPWKGYKQQWGLEKKNVVMKSTATEITALLTAIKDKTPKLKYVVLDDAQYIMAFEALRRSKETGFGKWNEIADGFIKVVEAMQALDKMCFILMHSDEDIIDGMRFQRAKTLGKLINNNFTLEGLFTIVLFTEVKRTDSKTEYCFLTNNRGDSTAKSPEEMFPETIPNDLKLVADTINNYFN